jgi:hypothetical protein
MTSPEAELPVQSSPNRDTDADEKFWQWVALVVLLACWLAEATF